MDMDRDCMDKKIEEALNDKDINNIMNKAARQFANQLDEDEIYTCKLNALWKSFLNFKPDFGTKFTTYLYSGVYIECIKSVKFLQKSKKFKPMHGGFTCPENSDLTMIDVLDEATNNLEREMLVDKASKMTNQELSEKYGIGKETMRKKMKKMTNKFRQKFV